ncbi:hypothetical protein K5D38_22060 [Pseudomonas cichorii]|nr:hypothetical protein [Pseudomonas cichorii]
MPHSYDLTQLDSHSFEHMVNSLALTILGKGVTGLAQGADGGRDGFLTGEAPYPTETERWSGTWYIQSKFHKPHLSKDSQKWLIAEAKKEIKEFIESDRRETPDIWIIATNIEPSGTPCTGSYDAIKQAVEEAFGNSIKFDIWGGRKVIDFLVNDPQVSVSFGHFLTPGHVLSEMYLKIGDTSAQVKPIINHLVLDQFNDQIYTKLEQAGGTGPKPKIHELFVDLPVHYKEYDDEVYILETLVSTSANVHKPTAWARFGDGWRAWSTNPKRARAIILKGGPGQGKSTAGQFFSQIQRAALLLEPDGPIILPNVRETAEELLSVSEKLNFKPLVPRIPISIELKEFASWHGTRNPSQSKGVLSYLCEKIASKIDQPVEGGTLKRAFETKSWFINFDGLDEVPNDVKDQVAEEVIRFVNVILSQLDADILVLCTTRPQGYSGQFKDLNALTLDLAPLPAEIALLCAEGVIRFSTGKSEAENCLKILKSAIASPQAKELMTTPLQSHIMAVVVKDGGRPPEKRWELFDNFYQVMKRRESLKNFPDTKIAQLLRENSVLLKAIHSRLGVSLHSKAERSLGAETTLSRAQFETLVRQTAEKYEDENIDTIVDTLMEATVQRLVFVSTPESSSSVRFDIRQLQEFFAAEFLYTGISHQQLKDRLELIGADSHWREVMHFAISALIVTNRPTELAVAINTILHQDDSDISKNLRTYKRRVAAGAQMTLRLMHEGVLEQDRSIRTQFKETLVPIYGMLDSNVTKSLCSVRHTNTLTWLLNCMIDALFELSEPEQINAAAVLVQKLPCNHSRREEVSVKIANSSPNYLNALYKLIMVDEQFDLVAQQKITNQKWFTQLTLELLTAETPLSELKLNLPLEYARAVIKTQAEIDEYDFPEQTKIMIWILINPTWRERDRQETFEIDGVSVYQRQHNWKTGNLPEELNNFTLHSNSPICKIIYHSITFFKNRDLNSLKKTLELSIKYNITELVTHSTISPLLPIDTYSTPPAFFLKYLYTINQTEFERALLADPIPGSMIPPPYELDRFSTPKTLKQFYTLSTIHPKIALAYWVGVFDFSDEKFNTTEHNDIALKIIQINPSIISSLFYGLGAIASNQPELFSKLRPLIRENANNTESLIYPNKIAPFALELPEELDLLPIIAQGLVNYVRYKNIHASSVGSVSIKTLLEGYGLDEENLKNIYIDDKISSIHRASALCCALLLATSTYHGSPEKLPIIDFEALLLKFLDTEFQHWYITTICYTIKTLDHTQDSTKELIGKILLACRERYDNRHEMQSLLADFRERSSAPVSNKEILEYWLKD